MSALDWMLIHECDDEEKPMQWADGVGSATPVITLS